MSKLGFLKSEGFRKALGIGGAVVAGVSALVTAIADQKKEAEFENMKKQLAELTKPKDS